MSRPATKLDVISSLTTFGDLLRYLRQRAQLTQRDLALAAGYSISQISRLEHNERLPDLTTISANFFPILKLQDAPDLAAHLLNLAAAQRGEAARADDSSAFLSGEKQLHKIKFTAQAPYPIQPMLRDLLPDFPFFYGRVSEIQQVQRWIADENCRLIAVLGMGGIGKTAFAAKLVQTMAETFEVVIWSSLLNAPSFTELVYEWLNKLVRPLMTELPTRLDEQLTLLLRCLQTQRCLLILDNVESILQTGAAAGAYRPGYEAYGQLLQQLCLLPHRSCLLLTSRERPQPIGRMEKDTTVTHSLMLHGLPLIDAHWLIASCGLIVTEELERMLVARYSGNPLALKLVTETVRGLFGGDLAAFLNETRAENETSEITPIFDDIRRVLDQQWERLSAIEQEITTWLAVVRQPVTSFELLENMCLLRSRHLFVAALRALERRSLLEHQGKYITLQNVVMEYITERLIEQICQEIEDERPHSLQRFALTQATVAEYVCESQIRMILQPIAKRLSKKLGITGLRQKMRRIVSRLRIEVFSQPNYAAGNILKLWLYLGLDPSNMDFSNLAIWQTDLRTAKLHGANFTGVDFWSAKFRDTFGAIYCAAFSIDVQLLAIGTSDFQIRIWHVGTQECRKILEGHTQYVWGVAFCPHGHRLASCSLDGTVRLWDIQSGQCLHIFYGHTHGVRQVRFSPDGGTLASASIDGTVRLWNLKNLTCQLVLRGHIGGVTSLDFDPQGQWLVTGGDEFDLCLWNVYDGRLLHRFSGHNNYIPTVAFSSDGKTIASGSSDHTVRLWDAHSGKLLNTLIGHSDTVHAVAFYQEGRMLVSGSGDRTLRLWDAASGQCIKILSNHTSAIWTVAASADGHLIASAGDDKTVCLWDARQQCLLSVLAGYTGSVGRLAFTNHGALLVAAGADGDIHLWKMEDYRHQETLTGHRGNIRSLVVHSKRNLLATSGDDGLVHIWDMNCKQRSATLRGHTKTVRALAFHPNGELLASAGDDLTINLWDLRHESKVTTLGTHQLSIWSLAFSPQNAHLASAGIDPNIRIWNVQNHQLLHTIPIGAGGSRSLTFNVDGRLLAIAGDDGSIRIWDVQAEQIVHQLHWHTQIVNSLTFSPDGRRLISTSYDKTICVWQFQQGSLLDETPQILRGHKNAVLTVAFHPTAPLIASCSMDKTLKIWDEQTHACLATLHNPLPYERMNIAGARGLTEAQRAALRALGAVEEAVG